MGSEMCIRDSNHGGPVGDAPVDLSDVLGFVPFSHDPTHEIVAHIVVEVVRELDRCRWQVELLGDATRQCRPESFRTYGCLDSNAIEILKRQCPSTLTT